MLRETDIAAITALRKGYDRSGNVESSDGKVAKMLIANQTNKLILMDA